MARYIEEEFPARGTEERNLSMWREWLSGVAALHFADKYEVSGSRACQVINRMSETILIHVLQKEKAASLSKPVPPWVLKAIDGVWIDSAKSNWASDDIIIFRLNESDKGRAFYEDSGVKVRGSEY